MKKGILILIGVIVVVLLVYNYLNTGKVTLIPSAGLSEEEREIKMLEEELRAAERSFAQAGRASAMTGVDTTSDAIAARQMLDRLENRARDLKKKTTSEEIKIQIEKLEEKIRELKNKMEI